MKADGRAVMRSMASGLLAVAGLAATPAGAADVGPPPVPLAEPALSIGDPAPALSVSDWVTRRDASEDAVAAFEPGEVYVVEFWATWCPPCVANIPHLGELADEFDGRVRVVSVSSEARDTVERFLDGGTGRASSDDDGFDFGTDEAAEDVGEAEAADPTYRELASRYDVAVDRDGLTNDAYMAASMSRGIPNAFVVGRDGLVEWVGHPARLDAVLAAVVAGTWDRAAFAEEFRAEKLDAIVEATFEQLRGDGRDDDAVALADWQIASAEGEDRLDAILKKVNLLLQLERGDEAVATTETHVADAGDD
ncbi:MAG: redoxin domain-containing protein, partial [Planctomycetota bacterium]